MRTKLYIPQIHGARVKRPDILAHLNMGLQHPLILLSSLPGSGKTTLLAEWVNQLPCQAAWLSLDAADNDLARFIEYFIAALRTIFPGAGHTALGELNSLESLSHEAVAAALINDLSENDTEFVLVLDDFHVIQSGSIQAFMVYLLERFPPQAHLAIATRTDPRFPLPRLRARNQILELRMDDLRFTLAETGEYLNQVMGLRLSPEDLAALELRTEGWVASLQMAALSLRHTPDVKGFIQAFSGSNRYVMDYLVEEALNLQPEPVQDFLLQTSILERLNGGLCDAVCPDPGAPGRGQEMLEFLERGNLFITRLDDERSWYRYHPLFASLLRARLVNSKSASVPELHRRAAAWYEQAGYLEEAIQHALVAQDYPRAAALIERIAEATWLNGQYARLTQWILALPRALARSIPWLCIWNAWSFTQMGMVKEADEWVRAAEQVVQEQPQDLRSPALDPALKYHLAGLKVLTACLAQDFGRAALLSTEVCDNPAPLDNKTARMTQCHILHGLSYKYYLEGSLEKAEKANLETIRISEEIGFTLRLLHGANKQAYVYQKAGRLQRCYRFLQGILSNLQEQGLGAYFAARALRCRSVDLLYEWDRLDEARQLIREDLNPEMIADIPYLQVDACNIRARDLLLEQNVPAAQAELKTAQRMARQSYIWFGLAWQTEALQVKAWLQSGDILSAAAWMSEQSAAAAGLPELAAEARGISRARILLASGQAREAWPLLEMLASAAEAGRRTGSQVEIGALLAAALQQAGQSTQALATLKKALFLAEPEGYCRTFIEAGAPVAGLLAELAREGRSSCASYARRLLVKMEPVTAIRESLFQGGQAEEAPTKPARPFLSEPLSKRELEVLGCMAGGLSNQETARQLVIEIATVKRHINSIFSKLNVDNRVQALNKAKDYQLID